MDDFLDEVLESIHGVHFLHGFRHLYRGVSFILELEKLGKKNEEVYKVWKEKSQSRREAWRKKKEELREKHPWKYGWKAFMALGNTLLFKILEEFAEEELADFRRFLQESKTGKG